MIGNGLDKVRVATSSKEGVVKVVVEAIDGAKIPRLHSGSVSLVDGGEIGHKFGRGGKGDQFGGMALEEGAHVVKCLHLFGGKVPYGAAFVALMHHNALPFKLGKSLADNVTFGARALHQNVFHKPLARFELAEDDVLLKGAHQGVDGTRHARRPLPAIGAVGAGGLCPAGGGGLRLSHGDRLSIELSIVSPAIPPAPQQSTQDEAMKTIIEGHTVHLHENPGAPTLVLTRLAARDGGVWDPLWNRLGADHQLVAVDLKRPSATAHTPTAVLKAYADTLVAVTGSLGTGPVHLVGWTGGSQIALQVAVHHPHALASLSLVTPFREAGERRRIDDGLAFIRAILATGDAELYARYWFTSGLSDKYLEANMDAVDRLVAARVAGDPFIGFDIDEAMDWMAALRRDHVDDAALCAIACPTLIVAAGQNRWHAGPSPQMAEAIHAKLPNSTLRLLPEAGPLLLIEAADTVAPWIAAFVARHGARPLGGETLP